MNNNSKTQLKPVLDDLEAINLIGSQLLDVINADSISRKKVYTAETLDITNLPVLPEPNRSKSYLKEAPAHHGPYFPQEAFEPSPTNHFPLYHYSLTPYSPANATKLPLMAYPQAAPLWPAEHNRQHAADAGTLYMPSGRTNGAKATSLEHDGLYCLEDDQDGVRDGFTRHLPAAEGKNQPKPTETNSPENDKIGQNDQNEQNGEIPPKNRSKNENKKSKETKVGSRRAEAIAGQARREEKPGDRLPHRWNDFLRDGWGSQKEELYGRAGFEPESERRRARQSVQDERKKAADASYRAAFLEQYQVDSRVGRSAETNGGKSQRREEMNGGKSQRREENFDQNNVRAHHANGDGGNRNFRGKAERGFAEGRGSRLPFASGFGRFAKREQKEPPEERGGAREERFDKRAVGDARKEAGGKPNEQKARGRQTSRDERGLKDRARDKDDGRESGESKGDRKNGVGGKNERDIKEPERRLERGDERSGPELREKKAGSRRLLGSRKRDVQEDALSTKEQDKKSAGVPGNSKKSSENENVEKLVADAVHSVTFSSGLCKKALCERDKKNQKVVFAKGFSNLATDSDCTNEEEETEEDVLGQNSKKNKSPLETSTLQEKRSPCSEDQDLQQVQLKKESNTSLWTFDEQIEKENIKSFWQSLDPDVRNGLVDIPKRLIISVLATHFKISCVCGKCHKKEKYVYNKLSLLYDRFYSDLMQEECQDLQDFYFVCLNDDKMSLRLRLGSNELDMDALDKSNKCFFNRLSHFLCESFRRRCIEKSSNKRSNESRSEDEEEDFEEDAQQSLNYESEGSDYEADAAETQGLATSEIEAGLDEDTAADYYEYEASSQQVADEVGTSESDYEAGSFREQADPNSMAPWHHNQVGSGTGFFFSEEEERLCVQQANLISHTYRNYLDTGVHERDKDLLENIMKAYRMGSYEQTKQILMHFFASYIPESAIDYERMSDRIDELLWSVNNSFRLTEKIKFKHDASQAKLEQKHSRQITLLKEKNLKTDPESTDDNTACRFMHLNLRQKQLEEQQRQLRRHYSEQKLLQRHMYIHLKEVFDTKFFVAPLDFLEPDMKFKIISEFKPFTCIDEKVYDNMTAAEYSSQVKPCLLQDDCPGDPVSDAEAESDEISEEELENTDDDMVDRYEECCRMFKYFAVKLFHQRVLKVYLELVSEKKQQALLEEEEEERQIDILRRHKKKEKRKRYKKRAKQKSKGKKDSVTG